MSKSEASSNTTLCRCSSRSVFYIFLAVFATILLSQYLFTVPTSTLPHTAERFSFGPPNITRAKPDLKLDRKVFLNTPDVPLWDPKKQTTLRIASGLFIAACLTDDRSALFINGQQFFPPRDINVPPKLRAPQAEITPDGRPSKQLVKDVVLLDLDYKWDVKLLSQDRKSQGTGQVAEIDGVRYHDGLYELTINILGAGVKGGFDTLMRSPYQDFFRLNIRSKSIGWTSRWEDETGNPVLEQMRLTIESSHKGVRSLDAKSYPNVEDWKASCNLWSWRCADVKDGPWYGGYNGPWYSIVMRQDFDEWGRIGCARRAVIIELSRLQAAVGGAQGVNILLIMAGAMLLWYIRGYFIGIANFYICIARGPWRYIGRIIHNWKEDRKQEVEYRKLEDEGQDLDIWLDDDHELPRSVRKIA